jgi:glycerol-3-phosphate dehydrogenase
MEPIDCSHVNAAPGSLNLAQRSRDLEQLESGAPIDVLVIGGGVTGAGVALDAVSRGLSVALVEKRDLANGTSRHSSKLIHGGLRYLRQFELGLAWESARERHIMMAYTAPHLVKPLPFLAPLNHRLGRAMGLLTETGIRVGDALRRGSGSRYGEIPGTHRINAGRALELAPALRRDGLRGALMFWDGQAVDDARVVICLARTAFAHGARVVTYCGAERIDGNEVLLHDRRNNRSFSVYARHIVNATGVWASHLSPEVKLRPSKGSHLIVRPQDLRFPRAGIITPVAGEQARWVGATPTPDGRVIIGVTDEAYDGPVEDEPQVSAEEKRFLLETLGQALQTPLTDDNVIGSYAGYRPLLDGGGPGSTADLSRQHSLIDSASGQMTTVVGGKFTTYRKMAQDTVDHLCRRLDHQVACCTQHLPLLGAAGHETLRKLAQSRRLVNRYGTEAAAVVQPGSRHPELLQPVAPGVPVIGAELLFGVEHEGALTVDDLLDRRVRLGPVPAERNLAEPYAQQLLAGDLLHV